MKQNEIGELDKLSLYRYETFFNVYQENGQYLYNVLRSINIFQANNDNVDEDYVIKHQDTWYSIAWEHYNTLDLWWLVCVYNPTLNPAKLPEQGTQIKLLRKDIVGLVLAELWKQINR